MTKNENIEIVLQKAGLHLQSRSLKYTYEGVQFSAKLQARYRANILQEFCKLFKHNSRIVIDFAEQVLDPRLSWSLVFPDFLGDSR